MKGDDDKIDNSCRQNGIYYLIHHLMSHTLVVIIYLYVSLYFARNKDVLGLQFAKKVEENHVSFLLLLFCSSTLVLCINQIMILMVDCLLFGSSCLSISIENKLRNTMENLDQILVQASQLLAQSNQKKFVQSI